MSLHEELQPILEAIEVHSGESFSFAGSPFTVPPGGAWSAEVQKQAQMGWSPDPLTGRLQQTLYMSCYAHRFPGPAMTAPAGTDADPNYGASLSQANQSTESWDPNWVVYEVKPTGNVSVRKGERHRSPMPGEFTADGAPGRPARTGDPVSLKVHRDSFDLQPGYYFAFGETLSDQFDDFSMSRFYFHTAGKQSAPALIEKITGTFNRYFIPFRMKTPVLPQLQPRTDGTVLYIARRHFSLALDLVLGFYDEIADGLGPETPLFSRLMRPGLGLAEDPGNGESFGMHRCRLLAEAVLEAWRQGIQTADGRWDAFVGRCELDRIDLGRPWLNSGNTDPFEESSFTGIAL